MTSKNVYLALDQSLNVTGYAFFNEEGSLLEKGTFSSCPAKFPIEKRLTSVAQSITSLIKKYNDRYKVIVLFEDIQNQNNAETFKKLSFVQAVVLLVCHSLECEYLILSPSHWRRILKEKYDISFGRKREEQKQKAIEFVKEKYHLSATSDEADAICLGCAGIYEHSSQTENAW